MPLILKIFIPGAASCSMVRQKLPEAGHIVRSGATAGLGAEEGLQGIREGSEGTLCPSGAAFRSGSCKEQC